MKERLKKLAAAFNDRMSKPPRYAVPVSHEAVFIVGMINSTLFWLNGDEGTGRVWMCFAVFAVLMGIRRHP